MYGLNVSSLSRARLVEDAITRERLEELFSTLIDVPLRRQARGVMSIAHTAVESWIVFREDDMRGVALAAMGPLIGGRGLSAAVARVRIAARLSEAAERYDSLKGLILTEGAVPANNWSRECFLAGSAEVLIAYAGISLAPRLFDTLNVIPQRPLLMSSGDFRVHGLAADVSDEMSPSFIIRTMWIVCADLKRAGRVVVGQGQEMVVEMRTEYFDETEQMIGVTVELGSISLSLRELSALTPGVSLEIECGAVLPCTLKVGSAGIIAGELSPCDAGLTFRVRELLG